MDKATPAAGENSRIERLNDEIQRIPDLNHVDTWLFDLDNTLYPARCYLFDQVDRRINEYVSNLLELALDEARVVQKSYFRQYGTTLRGLMVDHNVDPHHYMDYVHDIDLAPIDAAPDLDGVLGRLPGRKLIFTNGSVRHARNVTGRLGIGHHFEAVFDIAAADFIPKPAIEPYDELVSVHGIEPATTAFFDDIDSNLEPAAALGMTTVWVPGHKAWSGSGDGKHVHHVAEDLGAFLELVLEGRRGS